jgi:hypothetical protein
VPYLRNDPGAGAPVRGEAGKEGELRMVRDN